MIDMVRIQRVWVYLPSFLAVAESEHLRLAARKLRVSPSALSRSISILEYRIGQPLFERSGRRMRLTSLGDQLFNTVREVVRLVDETLASNGPQPVSLCVLPCAPDNVVVNIRELGR